MALADKIFFGIFIVILIVLGLAAFVLKESQTERTSQVSIGNTVIEVEVADSPGEHMLGLSNRDFLPKMGGMLFVFAQDGQWEFWMKNTRIPLDIIWADSNGRIVTIEKNVRPESYPNTYTSNVPARYVLEVNGGFTDKYGIVEGMQIVF